MTYPDEWCEGLVETTASISQIGFPMKIHIANLVIPGTQVDSRSVRETQVNEFDSHMQERWSILAMSTGPTPALRTQRRKCLQRTLLGILRQTL